MISIIMPVYNTGKFLSESIMSIIEQTYKEIELICVDDASDDVLTRKLLKYYTEKDIRIKLLRQRKRIGAAEARNKGLEYAQGEYVMFLDADDIFDRVMIEKMYESIKSNKADMCICGYREYLDDKKKEGFEILPAQKEGITNRVFCLKEMSDDGLFSWPFAAWTKMYNRDFLLKERIHFQTLSSSNDVFFSCMSSICANRIVYCQGGIPLLKYRINSKNQISARANLDNYFKAFLLLIDSRKDYMDLEEYRKIIYALMKGSLNLLQSCEKELEKKQYYDLIRKFLRGNKTDLVFEIEEANNIFRYFCENEYESKWFEIRGKYYIQLKRNKIELFNSINENSKIIIWGNGVRGNALQKLLKENKINSVVVTDIKNENIGKKTFYGYEIVFTEQVHSLGNVIIATNEFVYRYLENKHIQNKMLLLNLVKFCPYD